MNRPLGNNARHNVSVPISSATESKLDANPYHAIYSRELFRTYVLDILTSRR